MKKYLLAAALAGAFSIPAYAQVVDDPLHLCYATGCSAFGGVTVSTTGAGGGVSGWGVSSSPAPQSGTLFLAILTPNNEPETVFPTLTGTLNGNPLTLEAAVNEGAFNTGTDLTNLLALAIGATGSPKNPFSAFSGATLLEDPLFTDYNVSLIKVDGTFTTGTQAGQTSTLDNSFSFTGGDFTLGGNTFGGVSPGTIITAFLFQSGIDKHGKPFVDVVTTAQSSALLITPQSVGTVPEPSTWAMGVIGFGLMGLMGWRKRAVLA